MILPAVFSFDEIQSLRPPRVDSAVAAIAGADETVGERLCFAHPVGNAKCTEESKEGEPR